MGKDPLEAVKRKVYLIALVLALPAVLLSWMEFGEADLLAGASSPLFALLCLVCLWALWSWMAPIRLVERVMFAGGAAFALAQLVRALYTNDDLAGARTEVTEVAYPSLIALYVAAHLVFESRTAFRVSLVLYATAFAVVFVRILPKLSGGVSLGPEEVSWLLRMHSFMGAVIALVYASSYIKDQLTRQKAVADDMHRLAHTDPLTGIANRRRIYSELRRETEEARRYGRPLSVILFDLDHFKRINDTFGHDRGDLVLRDTVRAIEPLLRESDHLGRWGGEEFILVAPETDLRQSGRLAERLREGIARHRIDSTPGITASFGLAQYETDESPDALIKRADEALYEAKSLGRNRVEPAPSQPARRRPEPPSMKPSL